MAMNRFDGQPWDVVVVGAGPAGASAARVAAESGCRVLLLERAAIPRYKTCGGGLIGWSQAFLPDGLQVAIHDEIDSVTFGMPGRGERTLASDGAARCKMVFRDELDAALTEVAAKAGACVRDRTVAVAVEDGLWQLLLDRRDVVKGSDPGRRWPNGERVIPRTSRTRRRCRTAPSSAIAPHGKFTDVGLDSLLAVALPRRLQVDLDIAITPAEVWAHPSPAELSTHIDSVL